MPKDNKKFDGGRPGRSLKRENSAFAAYGSRCLRTVKEQACQSLLAQKDHLRNPTSKREFMNGSIGGLYYGLRVSTGTERKKSEDASS